MNEKSKTQLM